MVKVKNSEEKSRREKQKQARFGKKAQKHQACSQKKSEHYIQIRRHIRGLLNRLSESNVESITGAISRILLSIARGTASQIISEEVLASCSGGPRGNEQYAAVFGAFVAGMACLVGIDFSAKLIASLALCFKDEYHKEDTLFLRNLSLLLSYLYIFGVCSRLLDDNIFWHGQISAHQALVHVKIHASI